MLIKKSLNQKIHFRLKKYLNQTKECYFVMIKQSIDKEIITILNNYAPNHRALKYMKQKLIELREKETNPQS